MQKHISISLAILLFVPVGVRSQQIYFNNRYAFNETSWDGVGNVLSVDGGYLIQGGSADTLTGNYYETAFMFIDTVGNVVWKKQYGQTGYYYYSGYPGSLIKTSDGGYAFGNSLTDSAGEYYTFLMKFDANVDTIWTKRFGGNGSFYNGAQCKQTSDNGYAITGATDDINGSTNILLIKTDSLGNFEWQQTYGGIKAEYGYTIDLSDDGGFILGGDITYFAKSSDIYIVKTDNLGNQQWSKTFGGAFTDGVAHVIQSSNGDFVVAAILTDSQPTTSDIYSQLYILRLDSLGNTIWETTLGPVQYATNTWSFSESSDNAYIISGQTSDQSKHIIGLLAKVSEEGDGIWYRTYDFLKGQNSQNYLRGAIQTPDKGYISAGFLIPSIPSGDTGNYDSWVMKLDSCGCSYPQCDPQPVSAFSYTTDSLTVTFTNQSDSTNMYLWDFGDNSFSNDTNTTHTYLDTGVYIVTLVARNCSRKDTVIDTLVLTFTGINEPLQNEKVKIQIIPNPTAGKFTIEIQNKESEKPYKITVYDILGRTITCIKTGAKELEVDISKNPPGVYLIQVWSENNYYSTRVVKY